MPYDSFCQRSRQKEVGCLNALLVCPERSSLEGSFERVKRYLTLPRKSIHTEMYGGRVMALLMNQESCVLREFRGRHIVINTEDSGKYLTPYPALCSKEKLQKHMGKILLVNNIQPKVYFFPRSFLKLGMNHVR